MAELAPSSGVACELKWRFEAWEHRYIDAVTGEEYPHITELLERTGWVDDTWFTEESCERGTQAHRLTADYDLGALDVASCVSAYRGYLLSHVAAVALMQPDFLAVEEPLVHPVYRYGGRPDREVRAYGLLGVLEGKTAIPAKSHMVQTALQAILVAPRYGIHPEALARFCLYWQKPTKAKPDKVKFKLEEHTDRRDLDEAYRVIRRCCAY